MQSKRKKCSDQINLKYLYFVTSTSGNFLLCSSSVNTTFMFSLCKTTCRCFMKLSGTNTPERTTSASGWSRLQVLLSLTFLTSIHVSSLKRGAVLSSFSLSDLIWDQLLNLSSPKSSLSVHKYWSHFFWNLSI